MGHRPKTGIPLPCWRGFRASETRLPADERRSPGHAGADALNQDELILDHIYDIPALGRQAGHLILYLEEEPATFEAAADIMLDLKARFDEAGAPFAAMDLTLLPPRSVDGQRPDGEIRVEDFLCNAFVPNGLADRIREADQALKEHYAQEDAERKRQEAILSQSHLAS